MTWAKFDDGSPDHPKVEGLSDAAHRLWFNAVCYSNRSLTDGRITRSILKRLYPKKQLQLADELVRAGLWHEVSGGYDIHDFLTYQPSREKVMAQRKAKEMAGAKGAASRWGNGKSDAPVPVPEPVLLTQQKNQNAGARTSEDWYLKLTKRRPHNDVFRGQLRNIDAAHPVECIEWGWSTAASKDDPWAYAKRLFDSCGRTSSHGPREGKSYAAPSRPGERHPAATGRSGAVRRTSDFD